MFIALISFALLLYCAQSAMILAGLRRLIRAPRHRHEPAVTVVVAARNEQEHIGRCLESLVRLDYPREKLQLIVVDDSSTDRTAAVISGYAARNPNVLTFTAVPGDGSLRGKPNAVAQAIDRATGEIILQTDADCAVSPNWVREIVGCYGPDTGLVGGFTLLEANDWFGGIQALDWLYLFSAAGAAIGWKAPLTVVGNHLTYRRKAYDEVGGYRTITFSVTEDYALVRAVSDRTKWKFGFSLSSDSLVTSLPCPTFRDLYRQRIRWGVGGLEMKLRQQAVMGVGFILHGLMLAGLLIDPVMTAAAFCLKTAVDVLVLSVPLRTFRAGRLLRYVVPFELYFILYVVALPFAVALHHKVRWKGRTY